MSTPAIDREDLRDVPDDSPNEGPAAAIHPGRISDSKTPEERVRLVGRLFDRLEAIGTPEERAETATCLMQALAETRRAEGRVF